MSEKIEHVMINNNGVNIHAATQGEGPLVVLCHGMPGLWYSWRKQMVFLAEHGYKAVAIDQRGFGQSSRPRDVQAYASSETVADVIAVIDHFKEEKAILVGTDFGAAQVYNTAIRHPDRVSAVVGMACPFDFDFSGRGCMTQEEIQNTPSEEIARPFARPDIKPTDCFANIAQYQFFYAHWYQQLGAAETVFAEQPETFLKRLFWNLGADGDLLDQSHWPAEPQNYVEVLKEPTQGLPWSWMSEEDFTYYVDQAKQSAAEDYFIGGINLYRAVDINWHINADYLDKNITQPSLFIAGSEDAVLQMIDENALNAFKNRSEDLRGVEIISGAGHFVQMEKPVETNQALLTFLKSL